MEVVDVKPALFGKVKSHPTRRGRSCRWVVAGVVAALMVAAVGLEVVWVLEASGTSLKAVRSLVITETCLGSEDIAAGFLNGGFDVAVKASVNNPSSRSIKVQSCVATASAEYGPDDSRTSIPVAVADVTNTFVLAPGDTDIDLSILARVHDSPQVSDLVQDAIFGGDKVLNAKVVTVLDCDVQPKLWNAMYVSLPGASTVSIPVGDPSTLTEADDQMPTPTPPTATTTTRYALLPAPVRRALLKMDPESEFLFQLQPTDVTLHGSSLGHVATLSFPDLSLHRDTAYIPYTVSFPGTTVLASWNALATALFTGSFPQALAEERLYIGSASRSDDAPACAVESVVKAAGVGVGGSRPSFLHDVLQPQAPAFAVVNDPSPACDVKDTLKFSSVFGLGVGHLTGDSVLFHGSALLSLNARDCGAGTLFVSSRAESSLEVELQLPWGPEAQACMEDSVKEFLRGDMDLNVDASVHDFLTDESWGASATIGGGVDMYNDMTWDMMMGADPLGPDAGSSGPYAIMAASGVVPSTFMVISGELDGEAFDDVDALDIASPCESMEGGDTMRAEVCVATVAGGGTDRDVSLTAALDSFDMMAMTGGVTAWLLSQLKAYDAEDHDGSTVLVMGFDSSESTLVLGGFDLLSGFADRLDDTFTLTSNDVRMELTPPYRAPDGDSVRFNVTIPDKTRHSIWGALASFPNTWYAAQEGESVSLEMGLGLGFSMSQSWDMTDAVQLLLTTPGTGVAPAVLSLSFGLSTDGVASWRFSMVPDDFEAHWRAIRDTPDASTPRMSLSLGMAEFAETAPIVEDVDVDVVRTIAQVIAGQQTFSEATDGVAIEEVVGGAVYVPLTLFGKAVTGPSMETLEEGGPETGLLTRLHWEVRESESGVFGFLLSLLSFEVELPGGMSVVLEDGGAVSGSERYDMSEYADVKTVGVNLRFSESGVEIPGVFKREFLDFAYGVRDSGMSPIEWGVAFGTGFRLTDMPLVSDLAEVVLSVSSVEHMRLRVLGSLDATGRASVRVSVVPGEARSAWDAIVAAPSNVSAVLHVWDETDSHELFTDVDMTAVSDINAVAWGRKTVSEVLGDDVSLEEVVGGAVVVPLSLFGKAVTGPSLDVLEEGDPDVDSSVLLTRLEWEVRESESGVLGFLLSLLSFEVELPGGMSVVLEDGGAVNGTERYDMSEFEDVKTVGVNLRFSHSAIGALHVLRDEMVDFADGVRDSSMAPMEWGIAVESGVQLLFDGVQSDLAEVVLSVSSVEHMRLRVLGSLDATGRASLRLSVVPGQVRALYDAIVAAPSLVSGVLHVWDETDSHDLFTDVDMQVVQDFDQFTSGAESFEAAFGKSPHAFVTEDLGMTGVSISLGSDHCDDAIESCATLSIHLDGDNMLHDVIDAFPEVDLHFPGGHAGRFMTHKDDGMYGDTTLDIVGGIGMQPHRLASYVMDGFSNVATSVDDDVQVLDLVFGVGDLLPHQWAGLYDLVSVVLTLEPTSSAPDLAGAFHLHVGGVVMENGEAALRMDVSSAEFLVAYRRAFNALLQSGTTIRLSAKLDNVRGREIWAVTESLATFDIHTASTPEPYGFLHVAAVESQWKAAPMLDQLQALFEYPEFLAALPDSLRKLSVVIPDEDPVDGVARFSLTGVDAPAMFCDVAYVLLGTDSISAPAGSWVWLNVDIAAFAPGLFHLAVHDPTGALGVSHSVHDVAAKEWRIAPHSAGCAGIQMPDTTMRLGVSASQSGDEGKDVTPQSFITLTPDDAATPEPFPAGCPPPVLPSPSSTPSITPTISVTPSVTRSPTPSVTPSISETPSVTPSISETPSITPSPSFSASPSPGFVPEIVEMRVVDVDFDALTADEVALDDFLDGFVTDLLALVPELDEGDIIILGIRPGSVIVDFEVRNPDPVVVTTTRQELAVVTELPTVSAVLEASPDLCEGGSCELELVVSLPTPSPSPSPLVYSWSASAFTSCTATCGGGVMTRTVQCVANNGGTFADTACETVGVKPAHLATCNARACNSELVVVTFTVSSAEYDGVSVDAFSAEIVADAVAVTGLTPGSFSVSSVRPGMTSFGGVTVDLVVSATDAEAEALKLSDALVAGGSAVSGTSHMHAADSATVAVQKVTTTDAGSAPTVETIRKPSSGGGGGSGVVIAVAVVAVVVVSAAVGLFVWKKKGRGGRPVSPKSLHTAKVQVQRKSGTTVMFDNPIPLAKPDKVGHFGDDDVNGRRTDFQPVAVRGSAQRKELEV